MKNARARLAAMSIIHPKTKERIFHDREIIALSEKNSAALNKVFVAAKELSGIGDDELEEAEKNLSGDRQGGSSSG